MSSHPSKLSHDQSIQSIFESLLKRFPDLLSITASDKDGVILINTTQNLIKIDSIIPLTYNISLESTNKLNLGTNQVITSFYNNYMILNINYNPLLIVLIAKEDANHGVLMTIVPKLKLALEGIRSKLATN